MSHSNDYVWHEEKSQHNINTFEYLKKGTPEYLDWEINTLFYASCKMVDAYMIKIHHESPRHHRHRGELIELHLPQIESEYDNFYELSKHSRYQEDVIEADKSDALSYYGAIKTELIRLMS